MNTLKKHLVHSYSCVPLVDSMKDNKLIVVTPSGVISGTPVTNDETDESIKVFCDISNKFTKEYREENSIDDSQGLDGNDGFFMLKDVTLRSGSNTYNFGFLNVFFDQIIAVTVGNYS